jgi:OHCU decarboxylase
MSRSPGLDRVNALAPDEANRELLACCGSTRWAQAMVMRRPFDNEDELKRAADHVWWALDHDDWLEAFKRHPRIGGTKSEVAQSEQGARWSDGEQAGMREATNAVATELARLNDAYAERFGFIYIVCATGRRAEDLLDLLRARLTNDAASEIRVAAEEQRKITRLRLEKLLAST